MPTRRRPPESSAGEMPVKAVFNAIKAGQALPRALHVRNNGCRILLEPLAQVLACKFKVTRTLPALDFAKAGLMQFLSDPGPIPIG